MTYKFKMTDNMSAYSRGYDKDTNYSGKVQANSDSEALRKVLEKFCKKYDYIIVRENEDPDNIFLSTEADDEFSAVQISDLDDETVENILFCDDPGFGEPFVYYVKNEKGDVVFDNGIDEE